jgi:uroporphyrinogen-III decarboxylase
VIALTEWRLFHRLLEKMTAYIYPLTEYVAREFPGHLWRIFGPEYAAEPYLPPKLFNEYVVKYTGPMVEMVRKYNGYPRIHCHGRIKNILPYIAAMGATGLDPIEPPPQGDVELSYVRQCYGRQMTLFGGIEIADIEGKEPAEFEKIVEKALCDGTSGEGRGYVLMPSSCPYGRKISDRVLANYETMVRLASSWNGA